MSPGRPIWAYNKLVCHSFWVRQWCDQTNELVPGQDNHRARDAITSAMTSPDRHTHNAPVYDVIRSPAAFISTAATNRHEVLVRKKVTTMKLPESTQDRQQNWSRTTLRKALFSSEVAICENFQRLKIFLWHPFYIPLSFKVAPNPHFAWKLVSLVAIIVKSLQKPAFLKLYFWKIPQKSRQTKLAKSH